MSNYNPAEALESARKIMQQREEAWQNERIAYRRKIGLLESENKVLRAEGDRLREELAGEISMPRRANDV
jgi:hypothetical protein